MIELPTHAGGLVGLPIDTMSVTNETHADRIEGDPMSDHRAPRGDYDDKTGGVPSPDRQTPQGAGDSHRENRFAGSRKEEESKDDLFERARGEATDSLSDKQSRSSRPGQSAVPRSFIGKGSSGGSSERQVLPGSLPAESADSDESLFARYQRGDQRAFMRLYERYKSPVYGYCARALLSVGFDTPQVEDAFQEVFLRVAQYQHTFVGGEFKAWIFTVTRHMCLSVKKKGMRHKVTMENVGDAENLDDDVSREIRNALSRTDDPLEAMSKREQTDLLLKAIAELPETYREALILSDYEGMTYDEIGKLTGTSLSTIRIRVYRAKARLRKVLLPIIGDDAAIALTPLPEDE